MAVERNDFTEAIRKQGYAWYWENYDEIPTTYQEIFAEEDMSGAYVQETSAVGLNDLKEKPESEPLQEDTPMEGYPIYGKCRTFGSKVSWSMELYEDSQVEGLFQKTVQSWARSVPRTKDRWYSNFFNYGGYTAGNDIFNNSIPDIVTDPSGNLIYDSKPLFNLSGNTRKSKKGGTYYNGFALDLDASNLLHVYKHMTQTNNRDEKDDEIILEPDTLLVPSSLKFTAQELLQYENQFTTNFLMEVSKPLNLLKGKLDIIVWPRLSDSDAWFLLCRKQGLKAMNRMSDQIDFYRDPDTKAYIATIVVRWGGYANNWRFLTGSNFATS